MSRQLQTSGNPVHRAADQQIWNDCKEHCDDNRIKRVEPAQDDKLVDTVKQTGEKEKLTNGFLEIAKCDPSSKMVPVRNGEAKFSAWAFVKHVKGPANLKRT